MMELILIAAVFWLAARVLRRASRETDAAFRQALADLDAQQRDIEAARAELADIQSQAAGLRWMLRHHRDDGGDPVAQKENAPLVS
jgi:hypothetical protein